MKVPPRHNMDIPDQEIGEMDDPLEDTPINRIAVTIGALSVEVEGEDMNEVSEQFDATFERALRETGSMSAALREAKGYY